MKVINFKKMKTKVKYLAAIFGVIMLSACEKYSEVPPRTTGNIIRNYTTPMPGFLTNEEREIINQQRLEYKNL